MKRTAKRILSLLCVTVMLFTCCLSGLSVAAKAVNPYPTKWTILDGGENGLVLNYQAGNRFEKAASGFNARISEDYNISDIALYVHMTLDEAAVIAFEKGGAFELSQATMDQAERNWLLQSPDWQVGENIVLLPLGASASSPGSEGVAFDLYQPINYFRVYANPNAAEFAADSSVTIWEISLVDTTAAGVMFGENDTYLSLSEPITETPNTIEASVKVDVPKSTWQIGNGFTSSSGFRITWSNGTSAVTYNNKWVTDDTMTLQPAAGTPYAEFKPNGKTNTSGEDTVWCPVYTEEFKALDIPKSVTLDDLVFSGWMYVSDASAVLTTSPWIWLASTGSYSASNGGLTFKNMWADANYPLNDGWNYFEIPLSKWAPSSSSYPLDINDISGISVRSINVKWQEGTIEDQVTVRYADFRLTVAEKEETEDVVTENTVTEWDIGGFGSSSGFNTGWSSGSSAVTYNNTWVTDEAMSNQPAAGTVYAEFKANGKTASSGVWSPVFTRNFTTLDIPEGVELSDLKFSGWMYISDASAVTTPSPWFWLSTSSWVSNGGLSYSNLLKNYPLNDGWNYFEIPLYFFTQSSKYPMTTENIGALCLRSLNLTWLDSTPDDGVAGTVEDQAVVRYADFKISLIENEWSIGYPNGGRYFTTKDTVYDADGNGGAPHMVNIGTGRVGANEGAPEGLAYYAVTVNKGGQMAMANQSFTTYFPEDVQESDLALAFWMYTSTGEIPGGYLELTSSGKADTQEISFTHTSFASKAKAGWNYIVLPLSSPTSKDDDGGAAPFDYTKANFIRWVGAGAMSAVTEIRISEMKFIVNPEAKYAAESDTLLFGGSISGLRVDGATDGKGGEPAGLPYYEDVFSTNHSFFAKKFATTAVPAYSAQSDLVLNFWLYVDDVTKIADIGNIELSSSGKYDSMEIERDMYYLTATLKNGWNFVTVPLKSNWGANNTGGAFDRFAINYMRWHSMKPVDGETATVRIANVKLSTLADEMASWDLVQMSKGWGNQTHVYNDEGTITWNKEWNEYAAVAPTVTTAYVEFTSDGTADHNAALHIHADKGTLGLSEMFAIPAKYGRNDIALSFWMYINDADLLRDRTPEVYLGSAHNRRDVQYAGNLFADQPLQDGWNYFEIPLSKFKDLTDTFDMQTINFVRIDQVYVAAEAVVRYADLELKVINEPVVDGGDVCVTADDMVIVGNTNTADETPIALFTDVYGNVCWVWGDKQYTTNFNVCTGEWIDLALVRDMAQGKFLLYANGEVVAEADAAGTADIVPTTAFSIGADGLGVTFKGMIADVRLWSDVRTAEEIAENRVEKIGNKVNPKITAEAEGLIDAWFLVGDLSHVMGDSVTVSLKGNDLVFKGSRADDWLDYDWTKHDFLYDEEGNPDYYTMVFIPDIQNLVTGKYTEWLMAEGQWIADNVEKENIVHVMGAGDTTWNNTVAEYNRARAAWSLFEDKVSWSNLIGNHDYVWSNPVRDTTRYNTYYGLDYIKSTAGGENFVGYFTDPYGISGVENSYYRFKVNGVQWMILQLEFHPRLHVLDWANEILAKYPNDNVILTTHSYLTGKGEYCGQSYTYINGTSGEKGSADATVGGYLGNTTEKVWTDVAYGNPNVKMILCGHHASDECEIVYREDANVNGYKVPQMMINAQNLDNSDNQSGGYFDDLGVGLLGIMRFSADGTQVAMQYYSPYYNKSYGTFSNEITLALDIDTTCTHENTTTVTVDADCVNDGSITVTCDACGEVISTEVIPALGHKDPTGTWNAKQYCLNDCGTVLYDLEALLNAGGEVTLDRDLVTDKAITVNTAVVLNLAGYSISATELDTVGDGVFYVPAGGDLTINGEGTINGVGGNNYSMAIWANGGKVTINGGTYTNVGAGDEDHYDLIYVKNGGEVVINGGTFIAHTPVWTLNSHDTLKGTFTVNGGKFYKYDPANNITENPTKVWVADGFDTVA
ncbi:MAG: hypothetical protein E7549_08740, partial [Ruminococcaceae bacterium]|nr:hypothetical protein [Oscillospiraceae bacterium]